MEAQEDQLAKVVERLAQFGSKDREAVLRKVSAEEREQIESALHDHEEELRLEAERQRRIDRQFLGYSPWLAELVEQSENSTPDRLADTCAKALWEIHSAKVGAGMSVTRTGWLGFVDRVNDWLAQTGKSSA